MDRFVTCLGPENKEKEQETHESTQHTEHHHEEK